MGGLGIYLTQQVMDEVIHRITPQGGNELTLLKRGRWADDGGSAVA
jgi:anti-sigma regulatory factor (Ser/Thr protein kinase)